MPDIPNYQTLMLPVLRHAAEGEVTIPAIIPKLATEFQLTPEQLTERIPSGGFPVLNNRAHWAKTYMVKAGLVEQVRRGVFKATDRGRQLLVTKPSRVDNRTLSQFAEFRAFTGRHASPTTEASEAILDAVEETKTPAERIDAAIREIEAEIEDELIDRIFAIPNQTQRAAFFEELVVQLLTAMGYGKGLDGAARRIGGSGDGGVDGVIHLDALGIDRVYIQAKCYEPQSSVPEREVRDFSGSLDSKKTTRGVFITTAKFSGPCRTYIESIHKPIILIDGRELARLMLRYNVGVREDRAVVIKRIDEDFFEA
ncbi:MAG: restriction endonuclease [Hyphomicrobiaceae bacterium]|nr:restriction endonuclease [Hyphomicrobiaceae bacterium]